MVEISLLGVTVINCRDCKMPTLSLINYQFDKEIFSIKEVSDGLKNVSDVLKNIFFELRLTPYLLYVNQHR